MTETREAPILVDQPDDGFCETWGWLPVRLADTEEAAVKLMTKTVPLAGPEFRYEARDKVWLAPAREVDGLELWHPAPVTDPNAAEFWKLEVLDAA